jgi:hypothetical protein
MDLGDIHKMVAADNPLIRDVEIHVNREKRRTEIGVPQGVTAITEHGMRIPCAVNYAGTERHDDQTLPVYKILAEMDWRTTKLVRIEIKKWPDNIVMLLDFGGEPGDLPPSWVQEIEWAEVK